MSKRRILFLLELMLVICFSGCGSKKETGGKNVTKGSDLSEFVKVDELHSTDANGSRFVAKSIIMFASINTFIFFLQCFR